MNTEYGARLERVRAALGRAGLGALLATSPENIYYLSGYRSLGWFTLQALLVPREGAPTLIVRELELANAAASSVHERIIGYRDQDDPIALIVAQARGHGTLGVERASRSFSAALAERIARDLDIADGGGIVEPLRLIKSAWELDCIRRAGVAVGRGMRAARAEVGVGRSENDAAAAAYAALIGAGSEWTGAPPFVAAGPRSSHGHATWSGRAFASGDPVFLEVNAAFERYHAAQMRSVCLAPEPARYGAMVAACRAGVRAAIAVTRPGVPACDVDRAARQTVAASGFGALHRLRTGYSIGIGFENFAEGALFSVHPGNTAPLAAGMALHLLVYLYEPDVIGCAHSETVIVHADGVEIVTDD